MFTAVGTPRPAFSLTVIPLVINFFSFFNFVFLRFFGVINFKGQWIIEVPKPERIPTCALTYSCW